MISRNIKLLIGVSILLAYMSMGVFGLFEISHVSMPVVNCPYTQNSSSLCENSFDHINNWHQLSNATFSPLLILLFLVLGIVLYFFNQQNFLKQKQYFYKWRYYLYNKRLYTYPNNITKWLALFENSPSLFYINA